MVMYKKDILTMNKIIKLIFVLCCFCGIAQAQPQRPKLVVGIVIDQMRWDYLYRYYARYGEGGFKRMLGEGFSVENCKIPYIPSVTAIGKTYFLLLALKINEIIVQTVKNEE